MDKCIHCGEKVRGWLISNPAKCPYCWKTQEKELQKATIKNWSIVGDQLHGEVYGHPRFEDGTPVITSTIQKVITRNTEYTLEGTESNPQNHG